MRNADQIIFSGLRILFKRKWLISVTAGCSKLNVLKTQPESTWDADPDLGVEIALKLKKERLI
jgi:hypothetical protein